MKKRSNVSKYPKRVQAKKKKVATKPRNFMAKLPATLSTHKPEVKTVDFSWTDVGNVLHPDANLLNFSNAGSFTALNAISEGASFYNRIGRKISMKSIRLTYVIERYQNVTPVNVPEVLRVMLIYDRQSNGSFPSITDVLQAYKGDGNNSSAGNAVLCYLNMTNSERFSVLADQWIDIPDPSDSTYKSGIAGILNYNNEMPRDRYIKLKGLETTYKAQPAAIGSIATGGLYLVLVSLNTPEQCNYRLRGAARLRYLDI